MVTPIYLNAIFAKPDRANIIWEDVEALLTALCAHVSYGGGSMVRVLLNDVVAVFHKPHPQKEAYKSAVRRIRRFLVEAGITQ
ncbi:MAG: type II toxin-antitoxin system HicA family toxin [Chloroflexota bacterium]